MNPVLQGANDAVLSFLLSHPISNAWGDGTTASSDMMALDASRHLWNARIDPKRKRPSVGMYSHKLDRYGAIADVPIELGHRQAGAAIQGLVRQNVAPDLERLAVDTHGWTDFGLAVAKLLGYDLCPRIRSLRNRRLHIPRGMEVPEELRPAVVRDVSEEQIERGWDGLVRVAASIEGGWISAMLALERFGSAARADPIQVSGSAIGRLLRTVYLIDYVTNETSDERS